MNLTPRQSAAASTLLPESPATARRVSVWCAVFVRAALVVTLVLAISTKLRAADVTWNNNAANFLWNTTDANWSTGLWNNASIDNAFFGGTGVGAITVNAPINVSTLNFSPNGYSLSGPGPFTFVRGTSLNHLITGNIGVAAGATTPVDTPINSSIGLIKVGAGTLQLAGPPINFSGAGFPATAATNLLAADIFAGGLGGETPPAPGGTLAIMNSNVLPVTTSLGLANGQVDIGANNVTLGSVIFVNDLDNSPFNPATGSAGTGIIGSGTLRVTGEIVVLSSPASFNAGSNSIATNIDFGGGTQVIRTSGAPLLSLQGALQLTGVLSNGSLLKTFSVNPNGVMTNADGIGLFGNNTYTGSTVLNGGPNYATGTNASTSIQIVGPSNGAILFLQGANGSFLAASTILAASGGNLTLDNNAAMAGGAGPAVPAAQNNNRLADNVEIQLREGGFTYRGLANTAATETVGQISVLGGHNIIIPATSGTGTTAVTVAGDLTLTPRSTLAINSTTLAGVNKLFVNGTLPTADATGILPRVVSATDFVAYTGTTGVTPYTGYATDFSTPGTNVSLTAATAVNSSVNINALKRGTGSFAITTAGGVTLGITSGMILSSGGTGTYTGGTIAFGSAPGAFFGTNTVNSALTGNAGLLNAAGTLTLNAAGDLSGLSGVITQNGNGTITLASNTFAGALEVRQGALAINTSQTLAGQGAINIGVPANPANLVAAIPSVSISGAGANAVIARDIIVNNGGQNAAGIRYGDLFMPTLSVLSNVTGSQTVSGNITVDSPLRVNGTFGGAGATNFTGNIQGSSYLRLSSGRTLFSGNVSNAGGFYIGNGGGTVTANFTGTTTGSVPIYLVGSGADRTNVNYTAGTLPTGTITTVAVDNLSAPNLNPLDSSTINNPISLSGIGYDIGTGNLVAGAGNIGSNVGAGISATWAGPMSGIGGLIKTGVGILTLNNATNSYTGTTTINAGTLVAASDGSLGYGNVTLNAASVVLTLQGGATNDYIADTATLSIGFASDTVNLNYTGADNINALIINGAPQATGTWGAPGSGAAHTDPIFTGTGILNVVLAPIVTSAVSRKNHGGTDFDLPLPLAPNQMAIEPRLGGATNDYTIIVTFGDAVTVSGKPQAELITGSGAVGSGGTPNGGMVTVSGNTVAIPLTNVTNQQVIHVRLNGVNGSSTVIIPMGVLVGDVNGNGTVTASDISQTKAQSGQPVSAANFRADVITNGTINATDVGLVKSQSGASITQVVASARQ